MMNNYQDKSTGSTETGAGFQFEFSCQHCNRTWRSPFSSYKRGRMAGLVSWLALSFSATSTGAYAATRGLSGAAQAGYAKAREKALAEAMALARSNYTECSGCSKWLCNDCLDPGTGLCPACRSESASAVHLDGARAGGSGGQVCPSCGQESDGGRFCAGCGYDLASTHKSCPGCGAMVSRQARFCTDCGHGF